MSLFEIEAAADGLARVMGASTAYFAVGSEVVDSVAVTGSYLGTLPARVMRRSGLRGVVGVDCGNEDRSSVAGIWYLEALYIPAVTVSVDEIVLMDPIDIWHRGTVNSLNQIAWARGVRQGMSVRDAVGWMRVSVGPGTSGEAEISRRVEVLKHGERCIVCLDSVAFAVPADRGVNVLCCGGFAGPPNMLRARPYGIICSDGGRGRGGIGVAGLVAMDEIGVPAACVAARSTTMGDGLSIYQNGVISAVSETARAIGVEVGQCAKDAAQLMLQR
jgi:uncharacterized protein YunC (DUF1805 family)